MSNKFVNQKLQNTQILHVLQDVLFAIISTEKLLLTFFVCQFRGLISFVIAHQIDEKYFTAFIWINVENTNIMAQ